MRDGIVPGIHIIAGRCQPVRVGRQEFVRRRRRRKRRTHAVFVGRMQRITARLRAPGTVKSAEEIAGHRAFSTHAAVAGGSRRRHISPRPPGFDNACTAGKKNRGATSGFFRGPFARRSLRVSRTSDRLLDNNVALTRMTPHPRNGGGSGHEWCVTRLVRRARPAHAAAAVRRKRSGGSCSRRHGRTRVCRAIGTGRMHERQQTSEWAAARQAAARGCGGGPGEARRIASKTSGAATGGIDSRRPQGRGLDVPPVSSDPGARGHVRGPWQRRRALRSAGDCDAGPRKPAGACPGAGWRG